MKRVTGLGGIFFKAKDPKALYEWEVAAKVEEYDYGKFGCLGDLGWLRVVWGGLVGNFVHPDQ